MAERRGSVADVEPQESFDDDVTVDMSNVGKALPEDDYEGQTGSWKFADNPPNAKAGAGKHVQANVVVRVPDPNDPNAEPNKRTLFTRYWLNEDSLWRWKRDMVAIGADPADVEGESVSIGKVMRQVWGMTPTPLTVSVSTRKFKREGSDTEEESNDVKAITLRDPNA